ncbi:MAG: COQ9 family protein [Janthinobacterium lividum]
MAREAGGGAVTEPERSAERDAAIDALLDVVPFPGWTMAALQGAAGPDADLLFPGGAADLVEAYVDLADRRTVEGAGALGLESMRVPARVRALVAERLRRARPHREAVARAMAVLAASPGLAARCTARTVDAIWFAAGDGAADLSWYTKRLILAGVYGSTLLVWLGDGSGDDAASLAFLDRRLGDVRRMGRVMGRRKKG